MDPNHSLCEEEGAAERCTSLLALALLVSPDHPEALQCLASVRLSESNPSDAKSLLQKSYEAWRYLEADDERVPQLETRMNLSKLCVEVEMYNEALEILDGILREDDEDVEAWYLSGWTHFLRADLPPSPSDSIELERKEEAQDARICLEKCRSLYVQTSYEDVQLLEHGQELLKQLDALGIHAGAEEDLGGGEWEDGWEDEESEPDESGDVDMQ